MESGPLTQLDAEAPAAVVDRSAGARSMPWWLVALSSLLGTVVSLLFGLRYRPWEAFPDHLAQAASLSRALETGFRYNTLIHYPHEGGTIVGNLVAALLSGVSGPHALVVASLVLGCGSRALQIWAASRVFDGTTTRIFAIWTVLVMPAVLPWGTVSFGLHATAGCFPILVMMMVVRPLNRLRQAVAEGILLGLFLWFSYLNITLVPAYFLLRLAAPPPRRALGRLVAAALALGSVMLCHIAVRSWADPGFQLRAFAPNTVRGVTLGVTDAWFEQLRQLGIGPVASTAVVPTVSPTLFLALKWLWLGMILAGLVSFAWPKPRRDRVEAESGWSPRRRGLLLIPGLFLLVYALGSFFPSAHGMESPVALRHVVSIMPALLLLVFRGLSRSRYGVVLAAVLLLFSAIQTAAAFAAAPTHRLADREAGWVIGRKFGHDHEQVEGTVALVVGDSQRVWRGVGWGIAAALLESVSSSDPEGAGRAVDRVLDTLQPFGESERQLLIEGVQFAFEPGLTPRLDPRLRDLLEARLGPKEGPGVDEMRQDLEAAPLATN